MNYYQPGGDPSPLENTISSLPRKKQIIGNHFGTSSILLVFVVLCLVSFATLSIVSANADYILSKKIAERTISYYNACNASELTLSEINVSSDSSNLAYSGDTTQKYTYPIQDNQWLYMELEKASNGYDFLIRKYIVCTDTSSMEYNETLPVMK